MLKREHKVSNISSEAIFAIPAMKPSRVITAICFCLVLMFFDLKYNSSMYFRVFLSDALKPLSVLAEIPTTIYKTSSTYFSARSSIEDKLRNLEEENLKLKAINQFIIKLSRDNQKLNSLWSSKDLESNKLIISKKNFLSSNEYQPLLILNVENSKDVKENSAVLTDTGLIGRVNKLGLFTAEVMMMQDVRSSIPIISEKSSLHAILEGKGLNRNGELKFVKKTASFQEGEIIFTSGLGGIFPEGIPIGKIYSISDPVDDDFLKVEITFFSTPVNRDFYLLYSNEKK